ncbi:hypothetical protein IAU60_006140 [Kwoniella sp. DSM 27419]
MSRLHILGLGSIGSLIAHHLRLSNPRSPITLLVRDPAAFPGRISVVRSGETATSGLFDIASSEGQGENPISSLLVTVKAPQTLSALEPLAKRLGPSSIITLLQNGMGVYPTLCDRLFPHPKTRPFFILGTTPHGVAPTGRGKGVIQHHTPSGQGDMKWGLCADPRGQVDLEEWVWPDTATGDRWPLSYKDVRHLEPPPAHRHLAPLRDTIRALLSMTQLNSTLLPMRELDQAMLLKLAINAAINPLTAVLGRGYLYNGTLATTPSGPELVDSIVRETSQVLLAHLRSVPGQSVDTAPFEYDSLRATIQRVISDTHGNTSSMAVDVREKRGTEIDFINGYIVDLGAKLGIATPINTMLRDMIRFVTAAER